MPATACACSGSTSPYVREDGQLAPASWDEALAVVAEKLKAAEPERIGAIAGDLAGAEEMFALKDLLGRLGATIIDCRQEGAKLDPTARARQLPFQFLDRRHRARPTRSCSIGTNPRLEAPVLNARIRKRWRAGRAQGSR